MVEHDIVALPFLPLASLLQDSVLPCGPPRVGNRQVKVSGKTDWSTGGHSVNVHLDAWTMYTACASPPFPHTPSFSLSSCS